MMVAAVLTSIGPGWIASVMPLGRPVKQLSKLKRKPVSEFAMRERWGGAPLG